MAAYVTGDLGEVPEIGASAEIKEYLKAMIAELDDRLVDFETRIALNDAK
jgi:hypothetical protein